MIRWFKQYWAISKNALVISLGDPVYLVLVLSVLAAMAALACLPTFAFGQELRLIRDQSMALSFVGGCILGAIGAVTLVARDLRAGSLSVLMSRPVSGFCVVAGKWTGLAGAVLVYQLTAGIACLWMTRISFFEFGKSQYIDALTLALYVGSIIAALALMAVKHYFFGGWYVWQASVAICICFVLGFLVSCFFDNWHSPQAFGINVDWPTAYGCISVLFAQLVFVAILMPLAVKLPAAPLLGVACACFAVGLVSEFFINNLFASESWRLTLKALTPNWQVFWVSDFLADDKGRAGAGPGRFLLGGSIHAAAYTAMCLIIATLFFDRRELSGSDDL